MDGGATLASIAEKYPNSWSGWDHFWRTRRKRNLANNTMLVKHENAYSIKFHHTKIVTYHDNGFVSIDPGGWADSPITRERIDWFLPPEWNIRRHCAETLVYNRNEDLYFLLSSRARIHVHFGVIFESDGSLANPISLEEIHKEYRRRVYQKTVVKCKFCGVERYTREEMKLYKNRFRCPDCRAKRKTKPMTKER